MSAQDARVVDAIRAGIEVGAGGIRSVLGGDGGPLAGTAPPWGNAVIDIVWPLIGGSIERAVEKAIRAALDACGVATGHVQINAGPEASVGFEVLPQEEKSP